MSEPTDSFEIIAPGRVCLFGEHSDYLGLPVIPAAIDLCIMVKANLTSDNRMYVHYLDTEEYDEFEVTEPIHYRHNRDYLRSAFNVMASNGIRPKTGAEVEITGQIPIAAGLSSSSALTVASILLVAHLSGTQLDESELARLAYEAEVVEFGESGGMQDHLASSYGGIMHLQFANETPNVVRLPAALDGIVIGDSLESKDDTVSDLAFIRETVERGYESLSHVVIDFNPRDTPVEKVSQPVEELEEPIRTMTKASLLNRDLTRRALKLLNAESLDYDRMGQLLNEHHRLLRDGLNRSTEKIEAMISAARQAGSLGCKINGSGGGGTMMALAPNKEKEVAAAIRQVGGKPYRIEIHRGAHVTSH
ncbi:MAG: mevalonate kinase [Promethearchaeia archaeon]